MKRFIIHKDDTIRRENAKQHIDELPMDRQHVVEIKEYRKKRSLSQNAYIHAVPLAAIASASGHSLDEIKEYLCGERFGWEEYEMFGTRKQRPLRRTSDLDTKEMSDFIDWMLWWGSENLNLYIPTPGEYEGEY